MCSACCMFVFFSTNLCCRLVCCERFCFVSDCMCVPYRDWGIKEVFYLVGHVMIWFCLREKWSCEIPEFAHHHSQLMGSSVTRAHTHTHTVCASSKVESFFRCQSRASHHNRLMFSHTLLQFGWPKEFCIFLISLKILLRVTSFECEWTTKKTPIGKRGKGKKKKRRALMKLLLIGAVLKAKIELLLKIIATHLQIKFFVVAVIGLIVNIARFWVDLKRGQAPQKVCINYNSSPHKTFISIPKQNKNHLISKFFTFSLITTKHQPFYFSITSTTINRLKMALITPLTIASLSF